MLAVRLEPQDLKPLAHGNLSGTYHIRAHAMLLYVGSAQHLEPASKWYVHHRILNLFNAIVYDTRHHTCCVLHYTSTC